jgi:hypothetical protein
MQLVATGRPAWILSLILGAVLAVIGAVNANTVLIVAGVAFALIGTVFLILSLVTGGATD